jgi:hypothetical protein
LSDEGKTGSMRREMAMKVNGNRYRWVFQVSGVDMEKRRLQEAAIKDGDTQNGAGASHNICFNLPPNDVGAAYASIPEWR